MSQFDVCHVMFLQYFICAILYYKSQHGVVYEHYH